MLKATPYIYSLGLACFLTLVAVAQSPPPNDNYVNRTLLAGSDLSFSGTLMGATLEANPYEVVPFSIPHPTQTVWWQWTPAQSTTVIVRIFDSAGPALRPDALQVYTLQNIYTGQSVAGARVDSRFPQSFFTFSAQAGTNYQIQLAGSDGARFDFELIATDLPFIVENPKTQSVTMGDSVMFGVVVAGAKPFGYQWQRNGTNLPGETAPILALNQVATNQRGNYRVVITNSGGTNVSQTAELFVSPADTSALLKASLLEDNDAFEFTLLGDVGRRYRIQSSTNLMEWESEASFLTVFTDWLGSTPMPKSVVFNSSGAESYLIHRDEPQKLFRATPFHAVNEECNSNLKQLRFAQLLYAYSWSHPAGPSATLVVSQADLIPYLPNGELLACPSSGVYWITTVLSNPYCTVHPFEEP